MSERQDPIDELADSLFEAGREERASPAARARARGALGLGTPTAGSGSDSGSKPDDGPGESARPPSASGGVMKLVGMATIAGLVALGVWLAPTRESPPTSRSAVPSATVSPSAEGERVAASNASVASSPVVPGAESAPAPPIAEGAAVTPKPRPSTAPVIAALDASTGADASRTDDLAAELASLDRARGRLRTGDAAGALTELEGYAKNHPRGVLTTEATLLRIEGLVAAGKKDEARAVAAPLLERHDMTGDRARRLLER